ncbi:MAG: hypothetical protein Q8S53_11300 [Brevundimonas sp.]|uniref:hypothetical protein n=1 Tax=Brevundimonas sp. TaxID=1871086 RepID=UPI002734EF8D|nr:hypothetical protein [Brevundimonas sp.]MDP3378942.1 hypothetical protein [Brevundimonas sp.]
MREQHNTLKTVSAVTPGLYAADAAGQTVDRLGFGSVTFALQVGVGGITFNATNRIDALLEHSEDGTDWEPVPAAQVVGQIGLADDGIIRSFRTAHAAPSVTRFGYIGDNRFTRLTADFNGTHGTGTGLSAVAILGRPAQAPVT